MLDYTIRKATLSDCQDLNNLLTKLIVDEKKYDKNINELCVVKRCYEDQILSDHVCTLICEKDNKIIAYIFGYIVNRGDAYLNDIAKIDALYVEEKYQNNGLATSLINEFKKWTKEKNIKYIELSVCNENINAVKLYQKTGFKNIKNIMNIEL